MRLINVDKAKEQIDQMESLKPSERALFRLALDRTPTYEPPNPPLTLEELREMDGEPVWVVVENVCGFSPIIMCALVEVSKESVWLTNNLGGRSEYRFDEPIESGIAIYRRKPEEGTT